MFGDAVSSHAKEWSKIQDFIYELFVIFCSFDIKIFIHTEFKQWQSIH